MTDFRPVRKALEKFLNSTPGLPPVAWPNTPFDPQNYNGQPLNSWVRAKIIPISQKPASVGTNAMTKHEGIMLIDCFIREDTTKNGPALTDDLAQKIQDKFLYGTILTESGKQVMIRYAERVEERSDPPWSFVPVTITFYSYN